MDIKAKNLYLWGITKISVYMICINAFDNVLEAYPIISLIKSALITKQHNTCLTKLNLKLKNITQVLVSCTKVVLTVPYDCLYLELCQYFFGNTGFTWLWCHEGKSSSGPHLGSIFALYRNWLFLVLFFKNEIITGLICHISNCICQQWHKFSSSSVLPAKSTNKMNNIKKFCQLTVG